MVYLRHIAIAIIGCCFLGFQQEPESAEYQRPEATQAQEDPEQDEETESKVTWEEVESFEETKLTASDAEMYDYFGRSVAISGNTAIVGALYGNDGGENSGSAYLFDVTTGNQLFELTASDAGAGDRFGAFVAISGNTAIVGSHSGSAYLFDVATGNQLFKLTAESDYFGLSVGISGNIAIVGGLRDDDGNGSAYLFDVATGNQLFKLTATDAAHRDRFGRSVAISGNRAIVGAYGGNNNSGSAYLFDVTTGNQLFKLTASDGAGSDYFGMSVVISGNTAIVGAHADDDGGNNSGSAYLFDVTMGHQLFKLTPSDATANDWFGTSVAISGNTAVVGAYRDDNSESATGSAYLFDVTTGNQLFILTASDETVFDRFGVSVAISGNTTIVGAATNDDGGRNYFGAAYVFTPEP